jgi:SAM-dependent methyltransferase
MAVLIQRTQARELVALLERLFAAQNPTGADAYLKEHARRKVVDTHVNGFCWYARHLPATGAVLDWGSHHGPDSCLLRATFGEALDIHACDFSEDSTFSRFRAYARPIYTQLSDIVRLPYEAQQFDAVIGSGVLEHVAMDYESLREIHRVLKPGGLFVVTFYPYEYSLHEWWLRRVRKQHFHERRSTSRALEILLKRAGLVPFEMTSHILLPDVVNDSSLKRVRRAIRRRITPRFRAPTLCALSRKVQVM